MTSAVGDARHKPVYVCELTPRWIYERVELTALTHDGGMKLVWGTRDSYQRSRTRAALINLLPTLATLVFFTATLYPKRPRRRNMALLVSPQLTPRAFTHGLVLRATTPRRLRPLFPPSLCPLQSRPEGLGSPRFSFDSFDFLSRLKSR